MKFSPKAYESMIYELKKAFEFRTLEAEEHVKNVVHQCAQDCKVDSLEVENFVATACSHIYFDTLKVTEKAIRIILMELMNEMERERTKIFVDPPENFGTSSEA